MKSSFRISHSPSLFQLKNLYTFLLFCFFFCRIYGSSAEISYSDHCGSIVPESTSTVRTQVDNFPILQYHTSYYTGGENILRKTSYFPANDHNSSYSVSFYATRNVYETDIAGVYKVQAFLKFRSPVSLYSNSSVSGEYRSRHRSHRRRHLGQLKFLLNGFWSESSENLCMVGSASWESESGKFLELEAVFKLKVPKKSTVFTSLVKGKLISLNSPKDSRYFEPIKIVSVPLVRDYSYTLAGKDLDNGGCFGGFNVVQPRQFLSFKSRSICSLLNYGNYDLVLDYDSGCKGLENCSPFQRDVSFLPHTMSLSVIQCFKEEEKLRYVVEFSNNSTSWYSQSFDPMTMLIGEGSWQRKTNQMCVVACRILNPSSLEDARVGDCSIRLTFRFPVVWTINSTSTILGEIWTNNTVNDPGYFKTIKFRSSGGNEMRFPGLKYEYTLLAKARNSCSAKTKSPVKGGTNFPKGDSYEMRFQMSINHSGEIIGTGDAVPVSTGDDLFQGNNVMLSDWGEEDHVSVISEDEEISNTRSSMNMSYKITLSDIIWRKKISSLNYSLDPRGALQITAEGVYDSERGLLCMVGCRELYSYNQNQSLDCEILVNFEFPSLNSRDRSYIEGTIESRRTETDPLYFDQLKFSSYFYSSVQAKESVWRMDLEIILVLVSNSLCCMFVVFQIFYVKKHPEKLPIISITMLTILTLGHFIPLVLNFEALILKNRYQQNVILRGSGWLEVNEMSVRLVTMVAFLLLSRLLQLAWTARLNEGNDNHSWISERRVISVSLPLYIAGGLIFLLVSWKNSSNLSAYQEGFDVDQQSSTLMFLRSYAGLIVDGFLFPQILLNMFQNSRETALSLPFYAGVTLVRLLPHAYDLYRIRSFIHQYSVGSYIYANPNADFFSIAWDVVIQCGCILFAVIIWLQQRFGGRYILPRKLRELELYEKVPVVNSE